MDGGFYIGCTEDLKKRLKAHNSGQVESTKKRLPMKLLYYEACLDEKDAFHREKYLKTTYDEFVESPTTCHCEERSDEAIP